MIQTEPMAPSSIRKENMPDSKPRGLSDNSLGAIAYFTMIPAIILLVFVPNNKSSYVRFHAWQSILLNVVTLSGTLSLAVALYSGPFVYLHLRWVFWIACGLAWRQCVIGALNGKRFKLPLIGTFAEREADKEPAGIAAVPSQCS
jgi:uncharacterized membrane protein